MTRRSFGTRTMTGLNEWLYRTFAKGRSAEADLADFRAGATLSVYCATYDLGTPKTTGAGPVRKSGYLAVTAGQPVVWTILAKTEQVVVTASGPLTPSIDLTHPSTLKRIGLYLVDTTEGQCALYIPDVDADLVNTALASANAPA